MMGIAGLTLFALKKDQKLVKLTEITQDTKSSPEILYVFDNEYEAKEYLSYLEEIDPDVKWHIAEYQLVCSTVEWN